MLAILLHLGKNLKRTYFLRSTTRLKICPRVRMNLFSKSCFLISWINIFLLIVPLIGRWHNSLQITEIMNCNFKGFLKLLFFDPFSNWFGLQGWFVLECHIFEDLVPSGDNCQHHVCKRFVLLWFAIHYQMNSFVLEHCMSCCLIG